MPSKLKFDKKFQPCAAGPGDELFRNGIFEFNVSRLLAFIAAHAEQYPVASIEVAEIPDYGSNDLDEEAVSAANLLRPVLLAEIAPDRFNLIDGNHRLARARRDGALTLAAWRVRCPQHVAFLTTTVAYEKYVEYWNSKVSEQSRRHRVNI